MLVIITTYALNYQSFYKWEDNHFSIFQDVDKGNQAASKHLRDIKKKIKAI